MRRLTKTFVENRWYRRRTPGVFDEIPKEETKEGPSLDEQVKKWVESTGHIIIHPGQLGMHTTWHGDNEDPYQLKCLTFGVTVLYQEASHGGRSEPIQHADPYGIDTGANTAYTTTADPRTGGGSSSPADGWRGEESGECTPTCGGSD